MIRKGNKSQEPAVVFVSGFNTNFKCWVVHSLNTWTIMFSKKSDLIEFDYNEFQKMYYTWKIDNQDAVTKRYMESLAELK